MKQIRRRRCPGPVTVALRFARLMFKGKKSQPSPPCTQGSCRHFNLSAILKATNNFDDSSSSFIGRGGMGEVYKGEVFIDGMTLPAAFRRLNRQLIDSWPCPEVERLFALRHNNLVSLIGFCYHEEEKAKSKGKGYKREKILVHEYISNGTLKDHLHRHHTRLSWIRRLNICIGVARGLRYLHAGIGIQPGVKHGDIRSSNILLTQGFQPKISKFGLANVGPTHATINGFIEFPLGSLGYVDHHSAIAGRITVKSDVYSFGVVLLELLFRRLALDNGQNLVLWVEASINESNLADMIDSDIRNEISPGCLVDFFRIAKRCVHENPEERPDMGEVMGCLESILVLQERLNNPLLQPPESDSQSPGPSVKKFAFTDVKLATRGLDLDESKVSLGWLEPATLAPSEEGVGIPVAVKLITSGLPQSYNTWLEEVNFLGQLIHPNIIRFLGYCSKDGDEHLLVYEHVKETLSNLIHREEPLPWEKRVYIMIGVARGMTYLLSEKGVLCHFRCNDILLDKDFKPKIGGFRWEKIQGIQLNGVFGYLEADHNTRNLLTKTDICSFGFVLLEVITGRHVKDLGGVLVVLESMEMHAPESKSNNTKVKKIMDPRLKDSYSLEGAFKCMALARKCIAVQPYYRPTREQILWILEQIYALNK